MVFRPRSPFGLLLRRLRDSAGLSQAELAERCHMRRESIGILEREDRVPRRATVAALVAALGLEGAALAQFVAAARPAEALALLDGDAHATRRSTERGEGGWRATG